MKIMSSPLRVWMFTLMLTCYGGFLFAQTTVEWTLQSEKNGVKLYSKVESCDGKNTLILKFENSGSTSKRVNYNIIIESPGHNIPLLPLALELAANEIKEGSCAGSKQLAVDIKNITQPKLVVVMVVN